MKGRDLAGLVRKIEHRLIDFERQLEENVIPADLRERLIGGRNTLRWVSAQVDKVEFPDQYEEDSWPWLNGVASGSVHGAEIRLRDEHGNDVEGLSDDS